VTFEDSHCGQPFFALNAAGSRAGQVAHFRNIVVRNSRAREGTVNDYVSLKIKLANGVSYYFHDYPEEGRSTRVVSARFPDLMKGGSYRRIGDFTGDKVLAADVPAVECPRLLDPVDDLPPPTTPSGGRRRPRSSPGPSSGSEEKGRVVRSEGGRTAVRVTGQNTATNMIATAEERPLP
jgi:hypothetical protein